MMRFIDDMTSLLNGSTVIAGMGSRLRNDDAAGILLVEMLMNSFTGPELDFLVVEEVLENYVFAIAESGRKNVLLVDAVDTGADPGTVVFGRMNGFDESIMPVSSHKMCLSAACAVFERAGMDVWFLGIEAGDTGFGRDMSDAVKNAVSDLAGILYACAEAPDRACVCGAACDAGREALQNLM